MALIPCPECGRQVSDQAMSCPGCGHPSRKVDYCFVTVSWNTLGGGTGQRQLDQLLKDGWTVVDQNEEMEEYETEDDDGQTRDAEVYRTTYKLQRIVQT